MLAGTPNASRDRWFNDPAVVAIAKQIVDERDARLVRWVKEAVLVSNASSVDDEFQLGALTRLRPAARAISQAGGQILSRSLGDQINLRGAVLERIVHDLAASRSTDVHREQRVRLNQTTPPGSSNHKDVVVDSDPFEVYECKCDPGDLNQGDLGELDAIHKSALAKGRAGVVAVATFDSWRALERAVAGLTIPAHMKHACDMDLTEIGDGPPTRRLTKSMASGHGYNG
jgi:hypothetical protein